MEGFKEKNDRVKQIGGGEGKGEWFCLSEQGLNQERKKSELEKIFFFEYVARFGYYYMTVHTPG